MKFSIIIPAYNLEKHIGKCLNSLLNQNIELFEYEILVINDGSTDETESNVLQYTKKYSNIILYNQENKGVSSARNLGIENAKGEYVLFVDGDDWLSKNILNEIYESFQTNNLEAIRFGYLKTYVNENFNEPVYIKSSTNVTNGIDFIMASKTIEFYPWLYAFSTKFLKDNNLYFNTNLSFCEDKEFIIRALSLTKKFKNFKFIAYHYNLKREDAASANISDKKIKSLIYANFLVYRYAEEHIHNIIYKEYIKNDAFKAIKNSYYILTINSLWDKFWGWNKIIKNNEYFTSIKIKTNDKFFVLKKSSLMFYTLFYLPRACYHKIVKNLF